MTNPEKIAVLDIGKTNAKVVVLDCLTGAEIAERRIANRVLPGPPYAHYDIEALWTFTLEALKAFAQSPGFDAISITTHGASAALLDGDGGLAMPVLDYEQAYPQAISDAYSRLRPDFSETFSPGLSVGLNLGAQLHYQKTAFPNEFARTATILTYPQYWAFRLTGIAANEATSLGCHTDLWNPRTGEFSSLVDTLAIRPLMRLCVRRLIRSAWYCLTSPRGSASRNRCRFTAASTIPMHRFSPTSSVASRRLPSSRRAHG